MPNNHDILSQRFYQNRAVAEWFATKDFILPDEQAFLDEHGNEALDGRQVLDIGVGAGRTTRFLLPRAGRYVGGDYSAEMIEAARKRLPEADLSVFDASDLSAYADGEFDTVIFSFNGLDSLSNESRLKALAEMHRVLRPGGWLAFSSHNRSRAPVSVFSLRNLDVSMNPKRMLSNAAVYVRGIVNWLRFKHFAVKSAEYDMRVESGSGYKACIYYIDKKRQAAQLTRLGFKLVTMWDAKGKKTALDEPDSDSSWIFFVARKETSKLPSANEGNA